MGWVVDDIIRREWGRPGVYDADEWRLFLVEHGLQYRLVDLPTGVSAFIYCNLIIIQRGLSRVETARLAWHEIGHWACHVGDWQFWHSRPFGASTLRKMERQAEEFAERFPVWDRDGY